MIRLKRLLSLRTVRILFPSEVFLQGEVPEVVNALGVDYIEKECLAGEVC